MWNIVYTTRVTSGCLRSFCSFSLFLFDLALALVLCRIRRILLSVVGVVLWTTIRHFSLAFARAFRVRVTSMAYACVCPVLLDRFIWL